MQFTSCRRKEKKRQVIGGERVTLCVSGAKPSATHRHCYLPLAGGGWEEVLLTAGLPADTERSQSMWRQTPRKAISYLSQCTQDERMNTFIFTAAGIKYFLFVHRSFNDPSISWVQGTLFSISIFPSCLVTSAQ